MSSKDYYKILGVDRNSSDDDIKKSYRKLAMLYHPDRNPDDKEAERKFKEIAEAYSILGYKDKRSHYDRFGNTDNYSGGSGGSGGFEGFQGGFNGEDIFNIFEDFFSDGMGGRSRSRSKNNSYQERGRDLQYDLHVSFDDIFYGRELSIKFASLHKCGKCDGFGSKDRRNTTCHVCQGMGRLRVQKGFFAIEQNCSNCHGSGKIIKNPCFECRGDGRVKKKKDITFKVPPGISDGSLVKITGEGDAGNANGSNGDLLVKIFIKKHDFFIKEKDDLVCKIPLRMTTAILGGEISVPHLDGHSYKLNIPSGAQNLSIFKFNNKGFPINSVRSRFGDLYVQVEIETPTSFNNSQRELIMKLDKELDKSYPNCSHFFDKIKSWWKKR